MTLTTFWRTAKRLLIYGRSARMRPYERACLEAWRTLLTADGLSRLNHQLERLSFIQRQADDKLLCFYVVDGEPAEQWPDTLLFPCRLPGALVARVLIRPASKSNASMIQADVMLCQGRFFGLEFSQSPALLADSFEVVEARVRLDPMLQLSEDSVGDSERERLIATIDAKLPNEYLALAADAGATLINGWRIYNIPQVRKIVQPGKNYYLLAEKEGRGAIGVAQQDQCGQLTILTMATMFL